MDINNYKEFLLTHIQPWARLASGGRMILCRCFYCADSMNYNHGHFYISIPQNNNQLSLFYCQKCKVGGIVNSSKLLDWGIFNSQISIDITSHNSNALSLPENKIYKDSSVYKIFNDYISDDKLSEYKLKYLNNRLGTKYSYADCKNMKIVLNLNNIIERNKLKITRDKRIIDQLDSGFLGFLSIDNAFLNMRNLNIINNLHDSINLKYVNYNIFGKYDNTKRFYTIPTEVNFNTIDPINLHIAEGPFDILGIYNLPKNFPGQNIYTSIGGSGYQGILRFFVRYLSYPNLIIHIYPDNDINRDKILFYIQIIAIFKFPIYIHRNMSYGEKDFGVPIDRIKESIEKYKNINYN